MKSLELVALHRQKLDGPPGIAGGQQPLARPGGRAHIGGDGGLRRYAGNCVDAAEGLRESRAGAEDVPGFVLVIDSDAALRRGRRTAATARTVPRRPNRRGGGLPTAVNASPPVVSAPPPEPERRRISRLPTPAEPPDEPPRRNPPPLVATGRAGRASLRACRLCRRPSMAVLPASAIATAPDTAGTSRRSARRRRDWRPVQRGAHASGWNRARLPG